MMRLMSLDYFCFKNKHLTIICYTYIYVNGNIKYNLNIKIFHIVYIIVTLSPNKIFKITKNLETQLIILRTLTELITLTEKMLLRWRTDVQIFNLGLIIQMNTHILQINSLTLLSENYKDSVIAIKGLVYHRREAAWVFLTGD